MLKDIDCSSFGQIDVVIDQAYLRAGARHPVIVARAIKPEIQNISGLEHRILACAGTTRKRSSVCS